MDLYKQFKKENIINNLANYEMFYKVSLGFLHTTIDSKDLNEEIELQYALGSIYELLKELENEENLDVVFQEELKKQASMDALQFFVNENLEGVKSGNLEVESFVNSINDNQFFNEAMDKICEDNKQIQIDKWKTIITDELATAIVDSLRAIENN